MTNKDYLSNEADGFSVGRGAAEVGVAEVGARSTLDGGRANSEGCDWAWLTSVCLYMWRLWEGEEAPWGLICCPHALIQPAPSEGDTSIYLQPLGTAWEMWEYALTSRPRPMVLKFCGCLHFLGSLFKMPFPVPTLRFRVSEWKV